MLAAVLVLYLKGLGSYRDLAHFLPKDHFWARKCGFDARTQTSPHSPGSCRHSTTGSWTPSTGSCSKNSGGRASSATSGRSTPPSWKRHSRTRPPEKTAFLVRPKDWGKSLTRDGAAIVRRGPRIEACPPASIERESTIGGKIRRRRKRISQEARASST